MTGEADLKLWQRLSEAPVSSQAGPAAELFNVFSTEAVPELGLLLLKPDVELLLKGVFEGSPYLTNLVLRDQQRLLAILDTSPEKFFTARTARLHAEMTVTGDAQAAKRALRTYKNDIALLTALADLGGVWPVKMDTCAL